MAKLEGQKIADSYEQLLHTDRDGGGNGTTLVDIKDGKNDNTFALKLATDKVRIDKLGIATDSPSVALDVSGQLKVETNTDSATAGVIRNTHATGYGLKINGASDSTRYALTVNSNDDNTTFMQVLGDGKVGVGISPVFNSLHIHKPNSDYNYIHITNTTTGTSHDDGLLVGIESDEQAYILNRENTNLNFFTNNAQRMQISATGLVGIGTSSPASYTGGANQLVVAGSSNTGITIAAGTSSASKLHFADGTSGDEAYRGYINYTHSDGSKSDYFSIGTSAATRMIIDGDSRISLSNNDGGANNTTIFGYLAGNNSGSGATQNCYIGHEAGKANVYGDDNVLIGFQSGLALGASSGSVQNSLVGSLSGTAITDGDYNTFLGYRTGSTGTNDITTGTFNTFIGKGVAGSSASATNQTAIGADVTAQGDNTVTLGNADVTSVHMSSDSQAYVHAQNVPNHVANTMSSPYYRFDGVNDEIAIADSDILSFGDGSSDLPFSISAWIYMEDATNFKLISKGVYGSTLEYILNVSSDDKLKLEIYNGTNFEVASTSSTLTAYEGQWIHVASTYNGVGGASANAGMTLYINGVSQALTLSDSGTYTAMPNQSSEVRILNYADSIYGRGSVSCLRVWNKELTATEVKDDYSGMSVPFKYQDANKTSLVTGASSDMSGAGSWNFAYLSGSNNNSTVAGKMYLLGNGNDDMAFISSVLTIGKAYTFSLKARLNSGSSTAIRFGSNLNTAGSYVEFTPTGTEQTFTGTFLAVGADVQIGTTTAMGGHSGVAFEIDDVLVYPAGAVAEYDGSSAGSKVWGDKSGNGLHGTVGAGTLDATAPTLENTPYDSGTQYEEGTFTPTIQSGMTSISYNTQAGFYTKIGNVVNVTLYIRTDSGTRDANNFVLDGLPFDSVNTANKIGGFFATYTSDVDDDDSSSPMFTSKQNTNDIDIFKSNGARFVGNDLDSGGIELRISGTYFTA